MSSGAAIRRLKKEYATLDKESPPGVFIVRPLETNVLHAHFLLGGDAFYDTPYEGGVYHGVLQFPPSYPMKPPSVIMRTPSGRFQPDKKICFSMSDFHVELWNPMWNIGTILTGLVSFMNSEEITTGGQSASSSVRKTLAKQSLRHVIQHDAIAKELFASALDDLVAERAKDGNLWPPKRPPAKPQAKPASVVTSSVTRTSRRPKRAKSKAQASDATKETDTAPKPEPEVSKSGDGNTAATGVGKNAAKNKKKREREKRKKLARSFLSKLREQTPAFLNAVLDALECLNVDVSQYPADHLCWRTESMEEYTDLVAALRGATEDVRLLIESEIGGRNIATFELLEPIPCNDGRNVSVVEIPAPKDGRPYKQGLEHVEFVIGGDNGNDVIIKDEGTQKQVLQNFMDKYPGLDWNTKAIDKSVNPDVSLQVEHQDYDFGDCSVKFHLLPLSKVIEHEKEIA